MKKKMSAYEMCQRAREKGITLEEYLEELEILEACKEAAFPDLDEREVHE